MTKPTQAQLLELLSYAPLTGKLSWRVATSRAVKVGQEAGSIVLTGHRQVKVLGQVYQAYQLIWCMMYGTWLDTWIDHEDNDPDNNRISNLRPASPSQNACNKRLRSDSVTELKGVSKHGSKRRARIWDGKRNKSLGSFTSPKHAAQAYDKAALEIQGEFAKTNKSLELI